MPLVCNRELQEIDELYAHCKASEKELREKSDDNKLLKEELEACRNTVKTHEQDIVFTKQAALYEQGQCMVRERLLQEANNFLHVSNESLKRDKMRLLEENYKLSEDKNKLLEENNKKASGHWATHPDTLELNEMVRKLVNEQKLAEIRAKQFEQKVKEAEDQKQQALMLVSVWQHNHAQLSDDIERLRRENNFLKAEQNQSTGGAAACDEIADGSCHGDSGCHSDEHLERGRFTSFRLKSCSRCLKVGRDDVCRYHPHPPVGQLSWDRIDKYKEYAGMPEYSNHKYWSCCDTFSNRAGVGCMTELNHVYL